MSTPRASKGSGLGRFLRRAAGDEYDGGYIVGGLAGIAVLLTVTMVLLDAAHLDVWTAILTFLILLGLSTPLFRWVAKQDNNPALVRIFVFGLILKMLMSLVRYFVIFVVYKGSADAAVYDYAGREFVRHLSEGVPIHPLEVIQNYPEESKRIGDMTGVIYTVTGASTYAGFFVFSWMCLMGQLLFVRALKVAVPEADQTRYAALIFFLPSLLFWPSSIGKEAVMITCLGVITYGAALVLAPVPKARGIVFFAAGMGLVLLFRPHIALMALGALILAMAIGTLGRGGGLKGKGRTIRVVALIALVLSIGVVSTSVSSLFNENDTSGSVSIATSSQSTGTTSQLDKTLKQTSIGNSEFAAPAATSPLKLPWAVVSVLFRPFPWEAHNVNSLIAGAEGFLLLGLFAVSWRRVRRLPVTSLRRPYLIFALGFVLVFSIGFSFVGNFGILARERTQMVPFVLVFLALPTSRLSGDEDEETIDLESSTPAVEFEHLASTVGASHGDARVADIVDVKPWTPS